MPRDPAPDPREIRGAAAANVRAIVDIERENQRNRSRVQHATDRITAAASSPVFIVVHLIWFTVWIGLNTLAPYRFDAFPFSLLSMMVSLEAILLTAFVLVSQHHLTLMTDRRALLDLQVNLLAERELTAILKVVCLTAEKLGVNVRNSDINLAELLSHTDVQALSDQVTESLADSTARPIDNPQ